VAGGGKVKKKLPAALGEIFLLKVDEEETHNFTPSTQSNLFPILICFFLILIRIPFRKTI